MVIVTDVKWKNKKGEIKSGYYMDGFLAENLYQIPAFIKKDWDCVGIVSGSGLVRVGKSYIASQIGYFVAWLLAGGAMDLRRDLDTGKFINPVVIKSPTNPVNFSLNNLVFSPEDLMKKGRELPKNSVIIYDEGRSGLDAKSSMTALNRLLEDFFQECGVYNHVIILVLPDVFKLHADYAINRSHFLVNVYHDENYQRGYFNFYNKLQKEKLYEFGKKKLGVTARYNAAYPSFYGRFPNWIPFDEKEYKKEKKLALKKKELMRRSAAIKVQRDAMIHLYHELSQYTQKQIAEELGEALHKKVSEDTIGLAITDYKDYLRKRDELENLSTENDEDEGEDEENDEIEEE
ncbi:MAG: hypothetical protein WC346_04415 [Methanogenium sp.]|jgi:hypothetical protein